MNGQHTVGDHIFEPLDVYEVDTIAKLRVIANPLRMRILECLIPQARTAKEVGELLKVQSNTRYYHISELEKAGMIKVVDTVITSGIQQKYYRATGRYFRIEPTLFHGGDPEPAEPVVSFLTNAITTAADDLRNAFSTGRIAQRPALTRVSRRLIKASPEKIAEFHRRLAALEEEFIALHDPDEESFELTYALFPNVNTDNSTMK